MPVLRNENANNVIHHGRHGLDCPHTQLCQLSSLSTVRSVHGLHSIGRLEPWSSRFNDEMSPVDSVSVDDSLFITVSPHVRRE